MLSKYVQCLDSDDIKYMLEVLGQLCILNPFSYYFESGYQVYFVSFIGSYADVYKYQ